MNMDENDYGNVDRNGARFTKLETPKFIFREKLERLVLFNYSQVSLLVRVKIFAMKNMKPGESSTTILCAGLS